MKSRTIPATRPSIADFRPGVPYSTGYVAAFLGRSRKYVTSLASTGRIKGAFRTDGERAWWMIPGESVIAFVGAKNLDRARAAEAAALPTPAEEQRRAEDALKRLDRMSRKAKVKARKGGGGKK